MKNQADYSQYECPFAHLPKDCGHELHGPEGYGYADDRPCTSVWCACGFRGPVFYLDPEQLGLKTRSNGVANNCFNSTRGYARELSECWADSPPPNKFSGWFAKGEEIESTETTV